ncbi:MAG: hypothetical protein KTR19_00600 [Hyphomicrobiales bacterium]|nr:hypothetical protein [Hyphomicrobiales bacterium]
MNDILQDQDQVFFDLQATLEEEPEIVDLVDLAAQSLEFSGENVLAKLAAGETLGHAAGMPEKLLELLYGRALVWIEAGRLDRAEQIFQMLCMVNPKMADYWGGLGLCLLQRSAWGEALAAFDRAIDLSPAWGAMHFYRLEALVHMANWDEAARQDRLLEQFETELPDALRKRIPKYRRLIESRRDGANGEQIT